MNTLNDGLASEWNVVVNLGIKCNILSVSKAAGVRYFSSPFDNIDTVDGLVDTAKLMARKFKGHMTNVDEWSMENVYNAEGQIRAKSLANIQVPAIQYPHFHAAWSKGRMTEEEVQAWISSDELDIDTVWPHFSSTFIKRQKRLVSLLKNKNKILFLRVDTTKHYERVFGSNQNEHLQKFMRIMTRAYPETPMGLLYFYYNTGKFRRDLVSANGVYAELIPESTEEELEKRVIEKLGRLKLLPKEHIVKSA